MSKTIKKWQDLYHENSNCMAELLRSSNNELTKDQVAKLLLWAGEQDMNTEEYLKSLTLREPVTYAVDFDETLFVGAEFPQIGTPNYELISFLKERKEEGDKIILWTCRSGNYLKAAVKNANRQGLYFDAVNENLVENIEEYSNNCRKVYADYYIDDKNLLPFMGCVDYKKELSQVFKHLLGNETLVRAIEALKYVDTLQQRVTETLDRFEQARGPMGYEMIRIDEARAIIQELLFNPETPEKTPETNFRKDKEYGDYPTLEEIVRDYEELISLVGNVLTVEGLQKLDENTPLTIVVNDEPLETYVSEGGTDKEIHSIRYEAYGCLGYIYLRVKFGTVESIYIDVWSNKWQEMFIEDSSIDNVKANYETYLLNAEKIWNDVSSE